VVLDPVMVAKGGDRLLAEDAVSALRERLVPLAAILTPNLPEAAALLGEAEIDDAEAMPELATRLLALGPAAVFLKGGHLSGGRSPDYLATATGGLWLDGERIATRNTHGTGCTLSATLATHLAHTGDAERAARASKEYVARAIAGADALGVGSGHGPLDHFPDR
jgi:hydroxymethylpyrimidine/phosphomethylpyrimidine kinase